ncbi:hypothetical protein MNBD_BACTEROID03-288 [hydrothermal vent metagenome]|uniref:Uncharacterized protein n=1 Tax=hydrothermal vent metagenome TaxID=652676 RepID=A0A3B0TGM7_9ZZZZ
MKTLLTFTLFILSISSYAQTIERTETSDAELLEYLQLFGVYFEEEHETHYEKTRMWSFEYVIFYNSKPLYRGDILKNYYTYPSYSNNTHSNYELSVKFLLPIDDLDRETQLELRENERLKLLTGKNGKKYIRTRDKWPIIIYNYKKKNIEKYFTLSPKVTIKVYKTILK